MKLSYRIVQLGLVVDLSEVVTEFVVLLVAGAFEICVERYMSRQKATCERTAYEKLVMTSEIKRLISRLFFPFT